MLAHGHIETKVLDGADIDVERQTDAWHKLRGSVRVEDISD